MKSELEILRDLNGLVIREVGLELDHQYNVLDQDTGMQLQLNGKLIKYYFGVGPEETSDKILDTVHDPYLMNFLVSYYIEKIKEEEPDLYIHSYYPVIDNLRGTSALEFKGNFNARTKFYKNECLKFIEALFLLSGNSIDLSEYDAMLDVYYQEELRKEKRRPGGRR